MQCSLCADWRVAGMTYNKYTNLCAEMVRAALRPEVKAKAKLQEAIYYRTARWQEGVPQKQGAQQGCGGFCWKGGVACCVLVWLWVCAWAERCVWWADDRVCGGWLAHACVCCVHIVCCCSGFWARCMRRWPTSHHRL